MIRLDVPSWLGCRAVSYSPTEATTGPFHNNPLIIELDTRLAASEMVGYVSLWLQADIQSPEIDFRLTPNNGHSEAHAGLPLVTHSGSQPYQRKQSTGR